MTLVDRHRPTTFFSLSLGSVPIVEVEVSFRTSIPDVDSWVDDDGINGAAVSPAAVVCCASAVFCHCHGAQHLKLTNNRILGTTLPSHL